jgi:zinc D-Ala-D-Ala carboxypeptidase
MKFLHLLRDRLPFIALSLITMVIVLWAGLTIHSVFDPKTGQQSNLPQTPSPATTPLLPSWIKTAAPLVAPTLPPNPVLTPSAKTANPSTQPTTKLTPSKSQVPSMSRSNQLPQARYGHLPYPEDSQDRLVSIGTYGQGTDQRTESLDKDAAQAFAQMVADAKAAGVSIIPISGFRTIADQEKLFERQIKRQGSPAEASRLSAPPGYSEHHSGYALDIGDGNQPSKDLKYEFDNTAAYRWMQTHAANYGFELSFPPNNAQGVNFEPWHWRYIKSSYATAIFAVAHTLQAQPSGASTESVQ